MATLAEQIAQELRRDNALKQRIVARSPMVFAAMDAEALGAASSQALAERELAELGIEVGDNDPVALLDAHHSGRAFVRARGVAVKPSVMESGVHGVAVKSSAMEGMDASDDSYMGKYLEG